jgi:hypothetical protein
MVETSRRIGDAAIREDGAAVAADRILALMRR